MNSQVYADPLAVIFNEGLWRVNRLSPMHSLQYSAIKLKQYALRIRQALVKISTDSASKFSVCIEDLPMLRYSEEDPKGLMISITSNSQEKNSDKVIYSALLLSWGVSTNVNNAVHLPYMLERGEQKFGTEVKNTLQFIFDCNIKQYTFTQDQLLKFGFLLVENDSSKTTDSFIFNYKTPQVNFKDKLTLTFDIGDVHAIWNRLRYEEANETELVHSAYQVLQNQIYHMVQLDITMFDLCEVLLPNAEVKSNGVVKMKTPDAINSIFTVLNKITDLG